MLTAARCSTPAARIKYGAIQLHALLYGSRRMALLSLAVLVGMPALGLILQATVTDEASRAVIRDWGAAGAAALIVFGSCAALLWHLLRVNERRTEEMMSRLYEVVQRNTDALAANTSALGEVRRIVDNYEAQRRDEDERHTRRR